MLVTCSNPDCKQTVEDNSYQQTQRKFCSYSCKRHAEYLRRKPIHQAYERRKRALHKDRYDMWRKRWWYRTHYGITLEQFEEGCQQRSNKCDICGRVAALRIDHDHKCCASKKSCGKCLRGYLCDQCNHAIGLFFENERSLHNAIQYLRKYA